MMDEKVVGVVSTTNAAATKLVDAITMARAATTATTVRRVRLLLIWLHIIDMTCDGFELQNRSQQVMFASMYLLGYQLIISESSFEPMYECV